MRIAVVGINRYRHSPLRNAVNDARGVLDAFMKLGFEPAVAPLLDEAATGDAVFDLVKTELRCKLGRDDSLILFFAGHGRTDTIAFDDGPPNAKGYLLPVDADHRPRTWLDLTDWLDRVSALPPRHILVILDSCYSGVALDRDTHFRHQGPPPAASSDPSSDALRMRRSRRVITSALGNELARDTGPVPGHSLFAGCLIEAVLGGMSARTGKSTTTGSYLGAYVQDQVRESADARQNPDFGTLAGDHRGELVLPLAKRGKLPRAARKAPRHAPPVASPPELRSVAVEELLDRSEGWTLNPVFAAELDRHAAARAHGAQVLTVMAGDAMATQTAWATWAARQGYLTLATEGGSTETAIADLLAQTPWLRCLPEARRRVAAAARITIEGVDAALDARSYQERLRWVHNKAPLDRHAQLSGWLLSALRERTSGVLDLTTAPVQGGELLAIACVLACPTAVLVQHPAPDILWLEQAIGIAAVLTTHLPRRCVAVAAPGDLVTSVLRSARASAALTMARQGLVTLDIAAQRAPGRSRRGTSRALLEALDRDPRTRGRFELDGQIALGEDGPVIDVGLAAIRARIVVELDGWHHFYDPEGYRRDRIQDLRLHRAGYFVMRFLAEDVDERLASTVDQVALALANRRTQGALS